MQQYPENTIYQLYSELSLEDTHGLLMVTQFYERLGIATHYNRVDKKLIPILFGEVFIWWDVICFQNQSLKKKRHTDKGIEEFRNWLTNRPNKSTYSEWINRASNEREEYVENHKKLNSL